MAHALLIDFGSTYTKLRAVDLVAGEVVATAQGPSTVTTDVTIGLDAALAELARSMGGLPEFEHRLASSSAAGGLKMVTIGLVPELTAKAARLAALGAGAKLAGTYAFELTKGDVEAIVRGAPDMVLLSGGTDGGNRKVITENAARLAESALACPVVVAGNRSVADDIEKTLADAGKTVIVTENVMPRHLDLNIEPAREAIRQLFIRHIVHAKGIDKAEDRLDAVLMPTPAAVLKGARLLADGTDAREGLGPLVVVDIGGATTDVHSICSGEPSQSGVVYHGLPEPYAKRTVEGDLGMRHTARHVVEAVGAEEFAATGGLSGAEIEAMLVAIDADVERLPATDAERAFDWALAAAATRLSVTRHAGTLETVYTATGPVTMQRGKDLGEVATVIGTGGVLVHAEDAGAILAAALASSKEPLSLRPMGGRLMLDTGYALYACGLLAEVAPEAALAVGLAGLRDIIDVKREDNGHGAAATQ
ncbi:MAG: methylaspartate mutase accessory protein GlmL [Rhodospirillaceae bacterium]